MKFYGIELDENTAHCKSIVDDLESIVNGELLTDEYGELYDLKKVDKCVQGEYIERMELEYYSLYDYLERDVLDIKYLVDSRREYAGIELLVAFGGPNIYVSTISGKVELYWWGDYASWNIPGYVQDALNEFGEELFSC